MSKQPPNIIETLEELNAGVFLMQVEEILKQTALGVIYNGNKGKKGKVTLTFSIARVEDPDKTDKVLVEHTWALESPTKRGKKSETNKTDTEMYVSREGCLSIISYDQTDAFGKPAIVKNIGEK